MLKLARDRTLRTVWVALGLTVAAPLHAQPVAADIAVGLRHICALMASGEVRCWGSNEAFNVGDGTTQDRNYPVPVVGLASASAIEAGSFHSCALLPDKTLRCWGDASAGQVGNGVAQTSAGVIPPPSGQDPGQVAVWPPAAVAGLADVASVALGTHHSCAVTTGGAAWCWGDNSGGQLGNGTTTSSSIPVPVTGLASGVAEIAAGLRHTCARLESGGVRCWGANAFGQLGTGTTASSLVPAVVSSLGLASAIVAGDDHTCAIESGATARCWGRNDSGQLGDGTIVGSLLPSIVGGFPGVVSMAAGAGHTCAINGGGAWCWGRNHMGQLGDGTQTDRPTPTPVSTLASGVTRLAARSSYTCAVASGTAKCWGVAYLFKPDPDIIVFPQTVPESVTLDAALPGAPSIGLLTVGPAEFSVAFTPPASTGGIPIIDYRARCTSQDPVFTLEVSRWTTPIAANLTSGHAFSCTVAARNDLGYGPESSASNVAIRAAVPGAPRVVAVSPAAQSLSVAFAPPPSDGGTAITSYRATCHGMLGGSPHSYSASGPSSPILVGGITAPGAWECAVSATNAVGEGPESTRARPVSPDAAGSSGIAASPSLVRFRARAPGTTSPPQLVTISNSSASSRVLTSLSSSGDFTFTGCSPLPRTLGPGASCTLAVVHAPASSGTRPGRIAIAVQGFENAIEVALAGWGSPLAAGFAFSARVTGSGELWTWGENIAGQLGNGTEVNSPAPVRASGIGNAVAVSLGEAHALALTGDGQVWSWGVPKLIGRSGSNSTPQPVPGLSDVISIAAGRFASLAVRRDGSVWSWGEQYPELGRDGTRTPARLPGRIEGLPRIVDVAVAAGFALARDEQQRIWGWSNASSGFSGGPALLAGEASFTAISAGAGGHLLALKSDGTVWAWGWNAYRQLGLEAELVFLPQQVPGLSNIVEIAAGYSFSLARAADGTVYSWGLQTFGQLGAPAPHLCGTYSTFACAQSPIVAVALAGGRALAAGGAHALALAAEGSLIAVGRNGSGQLARTGDGYPAFDPIQIFDPGCLSVYCGIGRVVAGTATSGSGIAPLSTSGVLAVAFDASGPAFGAQPVGITSPAREVTLTNLSPNLAFNVQSVTVSGDFALSGSCGALAPLGNCTLSYTFTPTGLGERLGVLTVTTDLSADAQASRELAGVGVSTPGAPREVAASVSATAVALAFLPPSSDGRLPLTSYVATCNPGGIVASGPESPVTIGSLQTYATYTCTVAAANAAGLGPPSAEVSVTPIALAPDLTQSTTSLSFGAQEPGSVSAPQAVTFANVGSVPLAISSVTASTGFTVSHDCTTLAPAGSCEALVRFAPAASGIFQGMLVVESANGSRSVSLSGTGAWNPPRMANISTRMQVGTGNDVMIGGFVIGGLASKTVAILATGPSLVPFGITNPLANPTLRLVRSSDQAVLGTNDDWQAAANSAQLTAAGFAPTNALEAAILIDLAPGAYTAIVEGAGGGTGVALIGVYEVNAPEIPLVNISTRGRVLTGNDVMIGGFVIQGSGPQTVAILATGPSLAAFGITSPLANPTISLVRSSDQAVIATNDDWQSHPNAAQLQAAGFAPTNALESGLFMTLQPGAYTVIVQGVGGGTGVGLIGVYKVN